MIFSFIFSWIIFIAWKGYRGHKFGPSFFELLAISVLFSLNCSNPDTQMYENIYSFAYFGGTAAHAGEPIYYLLCCIAKYIGLDYLSFYCLFVNSCLFFLFEYISNRTKNVGIVFVALSVTTLLLDYVQIRQFAAMCIVIYGFKYLSQRGPKNVIKYLLVVAVAMGFHNSAVIFSIFLLAKLRNQKKVLILSVLAFSAFAILVSNNSILFNMMSSFVGEGDATYYLVSRHQFDSVETIILLIIWQEGFLIALLMYVSSGIKSSKSELRDYLTLTLSVDLLTLCMSPLLFASTQFKRLSRVMIVPSFINISTADSKKHLGVYIAGSVYVIGYFILVYTSNPDLITSLFENNYFSLMFGNI
ncbi:MAG: EpsG family protein [Gordonibacter sp.]|uniref:EpsG family protein n=1 Tax=Gordonibacter sp. TaxID=1968902 RepID=UPI0032207081